MSEVEEIFGSIPEQVTAPEAVTEEAVAEGNGEGIGALVDPDREVGVRPEDYRPFELPINPGDYLVMKAKGVRDEGVTKDGHPWARIAVSVVEGPEEGAIIEGFFSTTPEKFRRNATTADDLLHATGYEPYPRTVKEYKQAMNDCTGVFIVRTDLEARCFQHADDPEDIQKKAVIRGAKNIPFEEDGSRALIVPCPVCGGEMVVRTAFKKIVFRRSNDTVPYTVKDEDETPF